MSEIKQKRLQILLKLFGEQIKQKLEIEKLNISVKELLNKFSDYEITESGKYLEWMTKTYIENGFLYEDLYKVKETLEIFHENKMKLSKDKRDIQQYKTLVELWIEVKKFAEQKDDFLSTNEQKRKEKELAYSETEFLYEDNNLRLVAPLTEKSSKWWGKGTRWCTAADKNNAFYEYFKDAPLLVFDFKDRTKWQLWFFEDEIQFMDEDDNEITDKKIKEKWNLIFNIFMKLLKINGLLIKIIPEELITKKLCEMAVKQDGFALYNIAEHLITKKICEIAVRQNGNTLFYVPYKLKTKEMCEIAVKQNGESLGYVPSKFKTEELYQIAVKQNGYALFSIAYELKTLELCKIAVQNNGKSLNYVPVKFITQELCEMAVKNDGLSIRCVPKEFITQELCEMAVKNNGEVFRYIPKKFRTPELCELAVKQNSETLFYVEDKLKTKKLCELAVKQNNLALQYVPKKFITKEICEMAVKNNGNALLFVPYEFKTREICEMAVKQNNEALYYIPEKLKTKEICEMAEKSNIINNNLIQYKEIFSTLIQKDELKL